MPRHHLPDEPIGKYGMRVCILAIWLVLATVGAAANAGQSAILKSWSFDRSDDVNYDGFPDGWRRQAGPGYPAYQQVTIQPHNLSQLAEAEAIDRAAALWWQSLRKLPRVGNGLPTLAPIAMESLVDRYLRIDLNGGATMVQSPRFAIDWSSSYRVSLRMKTDRMKHSVASAAIVFFDSRLNEIARHTTEPVQGETAWSIRDIGPVAPPPNAVEAVVEFLVEPQLRADISGWVGFDSLHIYQLPQLALETKSMAGLHRVGDLVELECRLSGVHASRAVLALTLLDAFGKALAQQELPIELTRTQPASPSEEDPDRYRGLAGRAIWTVPVQTPGFYRVAASLVKPEQTELQCETSFAIIDRLPSAPNPFGWTMSLDFPGLNRRQLPQLLNDCHVGWTKLPCWIDPNDRQAADDIAWIMDRLQSRGIKCVGMLDQPASSIRPEFTGTGPLPAVMLFRDHEVWQPLLDPVMPRFNMKTLRWQLGSDRDFSFLSQSDLVATVDDIRKRLQGFGQPVTVALPWPWDQPVRTEPGGWHVECLSADEPLDAAALDERLQSRQTAGRETWILLDPIDRSKAPVDARVRDLVFRMIAVRKHGVEAAFVSDPLDSRQGLFTKQGLPGEMLLPWRTCAALLGDLKYVGALQMPGGSSNMVLRNDDKAVIVVWNDTPTEERLFLGEGARLYDAWGDSRELTIDSTGRHPQHRVPVGPMPMFLTGIDADIAAWRMSLQLEPNRLDSLLGKKQRLQVKFQSSVDLETTGSVRLHVPQTWQTDQLTLPFSAEPLAEMSMPLDVTLRNDATTGTVPVEIDFEFDGEKPYRFTVWREMAVGPEDLTVRLTSHIDSYGRLIIRQEIENLGEDNQRYDCLMFAPPRRRQRIRLTIPPHETRVHEFAWSDGKSLLGTMVTLRAEQIGGDRILNYRIVAEQ